MPYTAASAGTSGSRQAVRSPAPSTRKTLDTVSHKNGYPRPKSPASIGSTGGKTPRTAMLLM